MSKTHDLAWHLYSHITLAGTLAEAEWMKLKDRYAMPAEQTEEVLVLVIRHLSSLAGELRRETDRLSIALQRLG